MSDSSTDQIDNTTRRQTRNRALAIAAAGATLMIFNLGARVAPDQIAQPVIGIIVGVLLSLSGAMAARATSDSSARLFGRTAMMLGLITSAAHVAGLVEALTAS